tara:strand:+ start:1980 stop:2213 length:234 start_codon:yes stop_codon:yes gene_type:complete
MIQQKLIQQWGFITHGDMPLLIAHNRLTQCLVRCGRSRFTCAAQDVDNMIEAIENAGDYVRDVAVTSHELERMKQAI